MQASDDQNFSNQLIKRQLKVIELLSSLNYRTGELSLYLQKIACGVSELIDVHWSVVTLCQAGLENVLASSIDMGAGEHIYALHGSLTGTVIELGHSLAVEDVNQHPEYGEAPAGYCSYLGIPLRTAQGEIIGTICSFHQQPRKYSPEEIEIVELFAERAATAIDHYQLYQQQCQFNRILAAEVEKRTIELKAAQGKLIEQETLAAIGEFTASIVHEIRNPLTTMKMGLKYFQKHIFNDDAQERLFLALSEANRLERLLNEILLYAKPQVLQLAELEIHEFIQTLLIYVQSMAEAQDKKIAFIPANKMVKVLADGDKLKQVFINLMRNAFEASSPGAVVKCSLNLSCPGQITIDIQNDGEPIPPNILTQVMQPFFSTKPDGTGLGLAISKRIVNAHGGDLNIRSDFHIGTIVSVQLPLLLNILPPNVK
ncbi:GAF sensor signal transduction histidine kinase [Richelia sinica FACHB-800]|uniref:histidine kinase n=1 Tax=Richelia sinica FACHB-800 TaxID=1357546 RepID=A0A975TAF5_9NOST|nr:GAF domain-containing sensor histidine kinase [Richelia sinica]MBD2664091.1 GAF domain-containing protein [Richelia sinica FACHB-800]QXE24999.1 GAF sensor signal transduction histidine kinase [Richelia sinica FACHB-800]